MDARAYSRRNRYQRWRNRLMHPWPLYKRTGGISAIVKRADGTQVDLGDIADTYSKRWGVSSGT